MTPIACDLDEATAVALADLFKALADPTRVRLIACLLEGEMCVHELTDAVGPSQSAVSHQLRLLRAMRLVNTRREGRHVYYSLADDHVATLLQVGLEHVQESTT
ncbi:MAG: ArsR family transcriptional regulator [Ardenticatenia bacterium]|nr:ArsR family transcriptional regulator [Ardenticatena maritima]RME13572.1 MAG: ArsR family transcriptional regulator [Ardenticatenia bacterium]